jgi:hypothetical protein
MMIHDVCGGTPGTFPGQDIFLVSDCCSIYIDRDLLFDPSGYDSSRYPSGLFICPGSVFLRAGTFAGLAAAPVYTNNQPNITFEYLLRNSTKNACQFYWPVSSCTDRENGFFPHSTHTFRCNSGYRRDKYPARYSY